MDVSRFDLITDSDSSDTLFTVPAGQAYTITGFTIVETQGNSGMVTLKINNSQVIGQFGVDGPDVIYPIPTVNMSAGETLNVSWTTPGIYVTASVVKRDA